MDVVEEWAGGKYFWQRKRYLWTIILFKSLEKLRTKELLHGWNLQNSSGQSRIVAFILGTFGSPQWVLLPRVGTAWTCVSIKRFHLWDFPNRIHSNTYFNDFLHPNIKSIYKKYMAWIMIILGYHPIMYL